MNRSLSTAIDLKIPIEVWSNKLIEYSMLKVFWCPTYYHISEGKLEPRANKGVFIGYEGFRIWSLPERKVIMSKDVIFNELYMLHSKSEEDTCMAKNVTKQEEFENPPIINFSDHK